jgi:N-acetylglucosaminyldiphosphoundecaprenol N-acetyl-beta-D-mannosaminyltransferase
MNLSETSLFGVRVCASDPDSAAKFVLDLARQSEKGTVCVANVDMVTRARRDAQLRKAMQSAALVVSDGMPLVWMLRKLGFGKADRVYGPDFMVRLCGEFARARVPIFLYGGSPEEIEAIKKHFSQHLPDLQIAGAVSPPLLPSDPPRDPDVAAMINVSGAKVVFVGLGCPKQEYWMLNNAEHVNAVTVGVGYAFAQISGLKSRAPDWMARRGLEWLYRLGQEPKRLWRRYLIGNSLFVWYCLRELGVRAVTGGTPKW